ncbi:MAG: 16S rRNA (guanine(966)-N(2))-methyltransferase RsmD [Syntrophaceae bacterium]|nr:16S rRNA (guanine(966)-N(2))-methyltransferase RsmD [Syntrophaceae bacterium]
MKIIAGQYRGFNIAAPKGLRLRPTANLVREAVFNVIGPSIRGKRLLDLFAGSGAFGFEGLSREAAHVVFVDSNQNACSNLKAISKRLGVESQVRITNSAASNALRSMLSRQEKFSIIFLDPPYSADALREIMAMSDLTKLLDDDGLIICETSAHSPEPPAPEGMVNFFSRNYGETMVNMMCFVDAH